MSMQSSFTIMKGRKPQFYSPKHQRGVALMMVILIFALVSILAVGMQKREKLFIFGSGTLSVSSQAYQYALAAETYARRLLKADWDEDKQDNEFVDDREQVSSAITLPVDNALLEAQFNDMHGKLNLNDLVSVDGVPNEFMQERFKRLFDRLALDELKFQKIQDWIDENQESIGIDGAEDGEYLSNDPPYRTGGQVFVHTSELLLISGIDRETYESLLPFVSTLPQGKAHININTASAEVLQSLAEGLTDQEADALAKKAEESPWKSVQDFASQPELKDKKLKVDYLHVYSEFFELATRIILAERKVRLRSVLYRAREDGSVTLVQRDQGQKYLITKQAVGDE